MQKAKIIFFLPILLFTIGCSDDTDLVKEHVPKEYPSVTFEDLLSNYDYFDSYSWKEFETKKGESVVGVDCIQKNTSEFVNKFYKKFPVFQIQFLMNKERDDFQFGYSGLIWEFKQDDSYLSDITNRLRLPTYNLNYKEVCKYLYDNEKIEFYPSYELLKKAISITFEDYVDSGEFNKADQLLTTYPVIIKKKLEELKKNYVINKKYNELIDYSNSFFSAWSRTIGIKNGYKFYLYKISLGFNYAGPEINEFINIINSINYLLDKGFTLSGSLKTFDYFRYINIFGESNLEKREKIIEKEILDGKKIYTGSNEYDNYIAQDEEYILYNKCSPNIQKEVLQAVLSFYDSIVKKNTGLAKYSLKIIKLNKRLNIKGEKHDFN